MPEGSGHQCPYAQGCQIGRQHVHPFTLGTWGAKRCTCGSRSFEVRSGMLTPPEINCTRCKKRNYSATAYQAGRWDERKEAARAQEAVPGPSQETPF